MTIATPPVGTAEDAVAAPEGAGTGREVKWTGRFAELKVKARAEREAKEAAEAEAARDKAERAAVQVHGTLLGYEQVNAIERALLSEPDSQSHNNAWMLLAGEADAASGIIAMAYQLHAKAETAAMDIGIKAVEQYDQQRIAVRTSRVFYTALSTMREAQECAALADAVQHVAEQRGMVTPEIHGVDANIAALPDAPAQASGVDGPATRRTQMLSHLQKAPPPAQGR